MERRGVTLRAAGLLHCLSGTDGGAETALLRRLGTKDARPLRAAHPRCAAAVAAADWEWDRSGFFARVRFGARHSRRIARGAAYFAAALPRAACGAFLHFVIEAAATATQVERVQCIIRALPPTLRGLRVTAHPSAAVVEDCTAALCGHLRQLCTLDFDCIDLRAELVLAAAPPTLRRLCIRRVQSLGEGALLGRFAQLQSLDVSSSVFSDAALAAVPRELVALTAPFTRLTDGARFAHLPRLRMLHVSKTKVDDAALASVSATLVWLSVSHTALTGAARLDHLPRLRYLNASSTRVGDATLASVSRRLTELDVSNTDLTVAAHFRHLRRLRRLNASSTRVSDGALASTPPTLEWLYMDLAVLTDGARFNHLRRLSRLSVVGTRVGDAALASAPLHMTHLDVRGTAVTRTMASAHAQRV